MATGLHLQVIAVPVLSKIHDSLPPDLMKFRGHDIRYIKP